MFILMFIIFSFFPDYSPIREHMFHFFSALNRCFHVLTAIPAWKIMLMSYLDGNQSNFFVVLKGKREVEG